MDKLVLHPTDTSQWHALVTEAQVISALSLSEELESYLVFLLMRYCQHARMIESILALEFLESHQVMGQRRADLLQEVGDKSLLFGGLFPGIAQRRRISTRYFVDIGQSAYLTISELGARQCNELFLNLGVSFEMLQAVLNAMRSDYIDSRSILKKPLMFQLNNRIH